MHVHIRPSSHAIASLGVRKHTVNFFYVFRALYIVCQQSIVLLARYSSSHHSQH